MGGRIKVFNIEQFLSNYNVKDEIYNAFEENVNNLILIANLFGLKVYCFRDTINVSDDYWNYLEEDDDLERTNLYKYRLSVYMGEYRFSLQYMTKFNKVLELMIDVGKYVEKHTEKIVLFKHFKYLDECDINEILDSFNKFSEILINAKIA